MGRGSDRRLWRRPVLLAVLGVAFLGLLGAGWFAYDAASRARDIRSEVFAAKAELDGAQSIVQALASLDAGQIPSEEEIESALLQVRAAKAHLLRADARLGYLPAVLPVADLLPPADGASEVPSLLDVGLAVTDSADSLLTAVLPLLQDSAPGDERSLAERVRAVFVEDGDALDAAFSQLEATRPEVERLNERSWGEWLDAAPAALDLLARSLSEVPRAQEAFGAIRTGLDPLFGFDRPKTYLVAGLNESELRPTGGFMGTVGIVTVDRGHITTSEFERVYAFEQELDEYTAPPEDLARFMGAGYFQLRDANWWPDFPTSAEATLDLFEANQGVRPDGVIAINTLLTGRLVEVFAPLDLPEYDETLTAANWRGVMENTLLEGREEFGQVPVEVGAGPEGVAAEISAEGSYLHPLMEELIARSQSASADQLPLLLAALSEGSSARDIQAYSTDATAQAMLDQFGVSGRLEGLDDDERAAGVQQIAVVDSNVSWSKVGPGIHRDTTVLFGEDGYVDVLVRWDNRADLLDPAVYPRANALGAIFDRTRLTSERIDGVYGNYVRVYLPPGVTDLRIEGVSGLPRVLPGEDFMVAGGLMVIPPGMSGLLTVSFRLPEVPRAVEVWKQGGQEHDTLRVLRNAEGRQHVLWEGAFTGDVTVATEVLDATVTSEREPAAQSVGSTAQPQIP